jgi:ABC-type multidrug transport system fused ATPase/permease subunit
MDHGKIIESGTHDELVVLNGHYAQSWREQIRENG